MTSLNKRYRDLNSFLRQRFNERVQKISVDAGFTCPNRDGSISSGGCIYCNPKGSGTGAFLSGVSVREQLEQGKKRLGKRYKAKKFIAYFQSFTNTYGSIERIKEVYDEALAVDGIAGLSIGTRPDCMDGEKISLFESYVKKGYLVWIEYGMQTIHDKTLKFINRGHDFKVFEDICRLSENTGILNCAHVILGLPGETREDMLETARKISSMNIHGVKIHLLYVVKGTPLEALFMEGKYRCMTQKEYVETAADFVEILRDDIVIQRLTGDPHIDELVAPFWSLRKAETLKMIDLELEKRGIKKV